MVDPSFFQTGVFLPFFGYYAGIGLKYELFMFLFEYNK